MTIKRKKYVVVPRDALDMLEVRYSALSDAEEAAKEGVLENDMPMYVLEIKAVASRRDPPVTVRKI